MYLEETSVSILRNACRKMMGLQKLVGIHKFLWNLNKIERVVSELTSSFFSEKIQYLAFIGELKIPWNEILGMPSSS